MSVPDTAQLMLNKLYDKICISYKMVLWLFPSVELQIYSVMLILRYFLDEKRNTSCKILGGSMQIKIGRILLGNVFSK